ncbi:MAG: M14 family metallocarboxypeptidase [Acidihalobacter sp.]|uniref:M14 family metallopeptidase n=1 Tax=Acidihalobacter sp. TaxID=1872108 RepID=UPI00307F7AC8
MPAEASTGNDRAQAFRIHDNASEKVTTDEHQAIGTPGHPWGDAEITEWRTRQTRKRSYESDVLQRLEGLRSNFDIEQFGLLEYPPDRYPLIALRSRNWRDDLPSALITGGVHGYETSGVHGALKFAEEHAADYVGRINLLVVPCVSPWAYERVHRWNPGAIDPNRSFRENSPAPESAALMQLLAPLRDRFLMHIDLHETTDTDESEFRPSLAARDGIEYVPGEIPDGFYLVDDSETPQPKFQQAIIDRCAIPHNNGSLSRQSADNVRTVRCRAGRSGTCCNRFCVGPQPNSIRGDRLGPMGN